MDEYIGWTSNDPDDLLEHAVATFMDGVREGFAALWQRDDARFLATQLVDRRLYFEVYPDEIAIRMAPPPQAGGGK